MQYSHISHAKQVFYIGGSHTGGLAEGLPSLKNEKGENLRKNQGYIHILSSSHSRPARM